MKSIVLIKGDKGSGSGFIISLHGTRYIVSNAHVFIGNKNISIETARGEKIEFDSILAAKDRDLILFRMARGPAGIGLRVASGPDNFPIGQTVIIYGNSQGADVVTPLFGEVLGIGPKLIETSAEFVSGNSGSPLLVDDTAIGVATFAVKYDQNWLTDGTRFAEVRRFATRIDNVAVEDMDSIDMKSYLSQIECINVLESLVLNFIQNIERLGFLNTLSETDTEALSSSVARVAAIERWAFYAMADRAKELTEVACAIIEAKTKLEDAKRELERQAALAIERKPEIEKVIDALMEEQSMGRYGLEYWVDPTNATLLYAPVAWQVVDVKLSGTTAVAITRIESSTRGGLPIRKLWNIGLRYTSRGWRVLFITERN